MESGSAMALMIGGSTMSDDIKITLILNSLQAALMVFVSVVLMAIAVAVLGWLLAICAWLAMGYLGACLICGLVLHTWEGARTLVHDMPAFCDAPPLWVVLLLGPVTICRWLTVLVVTESLTGQRAEYIE